MAPGVTRGRLLIVAVTTTVVTRAVVVDDVVEQNVVPQRRSTARCRGGVDRRMRIRAHTRSRLLNCVAQICRRFRSVLTRVGRTRLLEPTNLRFEALFLLVDDALGAREFGDLCVEATEFGEADGTIVVRVEPASKLDTNERELFVIHLLLVLRAAAEQPGPERDLDLGCVVHGVENRPRDERLAVRFELRDRLGSQIGNVLVRELRGDVRATLHQVTDVLLEILAFLDDDRERGAQATKHMLGIADEMLISIFLRHDRISSLVAFVGMLEWFRKGGYPSSRRILKYSTK